jgi:hypothetical protein
LPRRRIGVSSECFRLKTAFIDIDEGFAFPLIIFVKFLKGRTLIFIAFAIT